MKKIILLTIAAFTMVFAACSGSGNLSGDAVDLKLKPKKGENYLTKMSMDMNMAFAGNNIATITHFDMNTNIIDVADNGDVTMEYSFKKIRMEMNMPGVEEPIILDPDNQQEVTPEFAETLRIFSLMKTMGVKTTMTNRGELKNLELLTDSVAADILAKVNQTFSDNMAKNYQIYPENPVKIGEIWDIVINQNMNAIDMKATNTYTLKQIIDGKAILGVKTKLEAGGEGMQGMSLDGTAEGEMTLFLESGMIADGLQEMEINMTSGLGSIVMRATLHMKTEKN